MHKKCNAIPTFLMAYQTLHLSQALTLGMNKADKLVTIATFTEATRAHVLKSKLAAEGVFCMVADGNVVPYLPIFSSNLGVLVKVMEKDKERALQIIDGLPHGTI